MRRGLDGSAHVALAVFTWTFVDAMLAGYGGLWFAPGLTWLATVAALPLAVWGVALHTLRRIPGDAPFTESAAHAVLGALIGGMFVSTWTDAFSSLAFLLPGTSMTAMLLALIAAAILAFTTARGLRFGGASVWALSGLLIVGPRVLLWFDHIDSARRSGVILGLALFWLLFGVTAARVGRVLGVASMHRAALVAPVLVWLACLLIPGPRNASTDRPSIVVVLVDTLRADRVDKGPGNPPIMAQVASLAESGTLFEQAIAPSPWTLPSSVSLLSAWNPHRHFVGRSVGTVVTPGRPEASFLGRALRDRGYTVAGFVNNPYLRRFYGFGRDFLRFVRYHGRAEDGVRLATQWSANQTDGPFFLLLHLMDPHWPYDAPVGYGAARGECEDCESLAAVQYGNAAADAAVREELISRYDAEVAYTDAAIGSLVAALSETGALDDAWLIVTADHGEEFWDHGGFLHGHGLFDEQLRVPLVIVPPRDQEWARGKRVQRQVRLEDVGATILDIAGIETDPAGEVEADALAGIDDWEVGEARLRELAERPQIDGRSLLPELRVGMVAEQVEPLVVAGFLKSPTDMSFALRSTHAKFVSYGKNKLLTKVYDLQFDAGETTDLARASESQTKASARQIAMMLHLALRRTGLKPGERRPLLVTSLAPSGGVAAELRVLGYAD
ncbi:MAG: arylsulfatase A-like enzyme [Candidatus Binatia bacterium]|jgi:arylsulfatase A-like enzyme